MIFSLLEKNKENVNLIKMIALLIHAAKIDEHYSQNERKMILDFIVQSPKLLKNNDKEKKMDHNEAEDLMKKAEEYEEQSNQILEYTREAKKMNMDTKIMIIKFMWKIILSDDKSDIYESNLMRRICGLLYVPDKLSGEIKSNILKDKNL